MPRFFSVFSFFLFFWKIWVFCFVFQESKIWIYFLKVEILYRNVICVCRVSQIQALHIYKISQGSNSLYCLRSGRINVRTLFLCSAQDIHISTVVSSTHPIVPECSWQILNFSICFVILVHFHRSSIRKQLERSKVKPSGFNVFINDVSLPPFYIVSEIWWHQLSQSTLFECCVGGSVSSGLLSFGCGWRLKLLVRSIRC